MQKIHIFSLIWIIALLISPVCAGDYVDAIWSYNPWELEDTEEVGAAGVYSYSWDAYADGYFIYYISFEFSGTVEYTLTTSTDTLEGSISTSWVPFTQSFDLDFEEESYNYDKFWLIPGNEIFRVITGANRTDDIISKGFLVQEKLGYINQNWNNEDYLFLEHDLRNDPVISVSVTGAEPFSIIIKGTTPESYYEMLDYVPVEQKFSWGPLGDFGLSIYNFLVNASGVVLFFVGAFKLIFIDHAYLILLYAEFGIILNACFKSRKRRSGNALLTLIMEIYEGNKAMFILFVGFVEFMAGIAEKVVNILFFWVP